MSEETGVWAYAIAAGDSLPADDAGYLSLVTGVGGAKVRAVECSGLVVLASDVSLVEFGAAALQRNLENLQWLDQVAQAHHHVIEAAAARFPLLPTRLATVYSSDTAVCAALDGRHQRLRDALRRVNGRVEWGVKAYAAGDSTDVPAAQGPAGTSAGEGGAGLAYLKRRRDQLAAGRDSRTAATRGAQEVHAVLTGKATAAMVRPPQSAQLSGVKQPMLLNAAYLLDASAGRDFTAVVAEAASAHPELRIELTGPWPPYSFANEADDEP